MSKTIWVAPTEEPGDSHDWAVYYLGKKRKARTTTE